MAQAKRKVPQEIPEAGKHLVQRLKEAILISFCASAIFFFVSLVSYDPYDSGWSNAGLNETVANNAGAVGAWSADVSLTLLGQFGYSLPLLFLAIGVVIYRQGTTGVFDDYIQIIVRLIGGIFVLIGGCGLFWFRGVALLTTSPQNAGGIVGDLVGSTALNLFGGVGGPIILIGFFLTGTTLLTGLSWLRVAEILGERTISLQKWLSIELDSLLDRLEGYKVKRQRETVIKKDVEEKSKREPRKIVPRIQDIPSSIRTEKEKQTVLFEDSSVGELPELSLLDVDKGTGNTGFSNEALEAMSRQVELKLKDFGIDVEVIAVEPGPVITRFELEPAAGIKASRITNLSKDLARSLSTISVRVVEVIPGKTCIGLEIPNEQREIVSLGDILKSEVYDRSASKLTMALGKDISGKATVADLAKMPHLLVAGTTGAGKSVALNAMILSLLYKSKPDDVRLIMIDPKMLELSVYEGIPALLAPVVTDMKEAGNALRWCVAEMERRYKLMAALGVRNLSGYNRKVVEAQNSGNPISDPLFNLELEGDQAPSLAKLPHIVVIIDELADMMMVVGKKVEELIARLAQKARAAGIHLILATQRPSVDVITGLIKANIPSRIAFQVSSRVDSRTILDQMGAETLLGHGDMLYLPPGTAIPMRVHGAFVSDDEVHKVVQRLKKSGTPSYVEEVLAGPTDIPDVLSGGDVMGGSAEEIDELYDQAVAIVTETRRASVSGVQRRLKIGYNRAARMVEEMERSGVVGELQSNGTRDVLAPPPPKD
ncbi:MAG: cell division protein FtsK [Thiotrichales bacterium]|nr:cell division protein FtsK [Thiotrichales bacterium]